MTKASEHVLVAKLGSARRRELQDIKSAPAFKSCPRPRLAEPVFAVQSIARRYNAEPKISAGEQDGRARQSRETIEKGHPNLERCWVTGPTLRKNPQYQFGDVVALAPSTAQRISIRQKHQQPSLLLLA